MAIVSSDIKYYLSGGSSNVYAASSLGGVKSTTEVDASLFADVPSLESGDGSIKYRCFYVHNSHATLTMESTVIWFLTNTPSADTVMACGVGTSAVNGTEQTIVDEDTAPVDVLFSSPSLETTAVVLGNIPAGQHKAVWLKRTVAVSSSAYPEDAFQLTVKCSTAA